MFQLAAALWLTSSIFSINAQSSRIVGGYNVTDIIGFRHQVSIRLTEEEAVTGFGSGHICGGSLVSFTHVLTAAHCVFNASSQEFLPATFLVTVMGGLNRYVNDANTIVEPVTRIVGHESFNHQTFANDIAVLHLAQAVPLSHPTVSPINFPSQAPSVGQTCIVSGWGRLSQVGSESVILMAANVTINDRAECNLPYRYNGLVLEEMFCAGPFAGGVDGCYGDFGGPLTCGNVLVGVFSNSIECALAEFPGVYIDVFNYVDWIFSKGFEELTTTTSTTTTDDAHLIAAKFVWVLLSVLIANIRR